jgi:4a-hydroxytetrahydrobiopterin dehydratase
MGVLTDEQVSRRLATLDGWSRAGDAIRRTYRFDSFAAAIAFVNRVADVAEGMDHHPDIDIRYRDVTLTLSTHSEGGITEKDLDLARQIG